MKKQIDNFTATFALIGFLTISVALGLFLASLVGCQKKPTAQSSEPAPTKVWCFYQMNYGKAFFKCCKTEKEYQETYDQGIANGLNLSVEIKNNCNECQ